MALLQEIQVPLLAVNDTILTVIELSIAPGAAVKKGELVMVFETSKTTYDVEATVDGFVQYWCEAGKDYEVNTVVARIYSDAAEAAAPAPKPAGPTAAPRDPQPAPASPEETPSHWAGNTLFSHEAERLIAAAGLHKDIFAGRDFVSGAVVRAHLANKPAATPVTKTVATPIAKAVLPADPAKTILQKLASAKRREIEYLSEVQSTGLISTLHTQVETAGIFTHINRAQQYLKDSLLPVILYETSRLLRDYPLLNAYFTGEATAVYKEVNPGFAIDIEDKGLKVVRVEQADQKTIAAIEADILRLSGDYLDDKLKVEQLSDISFTITDLAAEGVAFFQPLVNKMNSAILGVGAIDQRLQRCTLSLTFDHRVTEGKTVAGFLRELKERLESYRPDPRELYRGISCSKCYKTLSEDLSGIGFVRSVTPDGKEGYLCQTCLQGF